MRVPTGIPNRSRPGVATLLAGGALVAGCGSGGGETPLATPTPPEAQAPSAPAPPADAPPDTTVR